MLPHGFHKLAVRHSNSDCICQLRHEIRLLEDRSRASRWFPNLEEKRENSGDKCLTPEYSAKEIPDRGV